MTLTVLESFPPPRRTTNPYIVMLAESLTKTPGLRMLHFSWRTALLGRYDVFHVHWPEILLNGSSPARRAVRRLLFALLLLRLWVARTPLVKTRHNLGAHEDVSWIDASLLRAAERLTTTWVLINTSVSDDLDEARTVQILHGHYRDWYAEHPREQVVQGRMAYFGLIRRYKNVDALVRVFRELPGPRSLIVTGKPDSTQLESEVEAAAAGDERITLDLRFIDDGELVSAVTSAELVVLPYREMHNSGSVLAALSLDRPVLVPANQVNDLLAHEVGPGWVLTYEGALTPEHVERALARLADHPVRGRPDLSGRDWSRAGAEHLAVFERAVSRRKGGRIARRRAAAGLENPQA